MLRCWLLAAGLTLAATQAGAEALVAYRVVGDAVPLPLTGQKGDSWRGIGIIGSPDGGNCVLCHHIPLPTLGKRIFGNTAPDLAGIGTRLNEGQLRLRVIDQTRLNEKTLMPAYYRTDKLTRVAAPYRGKPILTAQQVEDVVAYLMTLRQ